MASVASRAGVLVVAAGQAALIGADHVAPGAVVIDVAGGRLVGDVDTEAVAAIAAVTPVPGW